MRNRIEKDFLCAAIIFIGAMLLAPHSHATMLQQGLGAAQCTNSPSSSTDAQLFVSTGGSDSNSGLCWGQAFLTIAKAITSLAANGGHIWIGCGTFSYAAALSITTSGTILSGSGWGQSNNSNGCTILHPNSGIDGIDVTGANYVTLEHFRILSASSGAGSDIGIHVSGVSLRPTIRNVTVEHTGSHGVNLDSSSAGNVDGWLLDHVSVLSAFGDCFEFTGGNDTNVGTAHTLSAIGCTGLGYKSTGGNGMRSNILINLQAQANTGGDYDFEAGSGNRFLGVYAETGASSTFIFGASFTDNEVWFDWFGAPATVTNTGGASNRFHLFDASNNPLDNALAVGPLTGATTPTTYAFLSGSFNNGWLSLRDLTNSKDIMTCVNSTGVCSFLNAPLTAPTFTSNVAIGTAPFTVTSTTPVANLTLAGQPKPVASTTAVTSSNPTINTDQNLIQLSLPAGFLNTLTGTFNLTGSGIYSSTAASSPALTIKAKLCTVSGCGSGTVVPLLNIVTSALNATALTNATWNITGTCVTNATGATGNLVCHGSPGLALDTGAALSTPYSLFADTNTATLANIDLTAALFVQFTVAQSVVGASNSYTQQLASIR
jgi:hypothetical protein